MHLSVQEAKMGKKIQYAQKVENALYDYIIHPSGVLEYVFMQGHNNLTIGHLASSRWFGVPRIYRPLGVRFRLYC